MVNHFNPFYVKIYLILIGKTSVQPVADAMNDYLKRVERYGRFEVKVLPELRNTKSMPVEVQLQKEAEMLLPLIESYQEVILLDEKGRELSSEEFAGFIQKKQNSGLRDMAFVVGGPYGFSESVKSAATERLSLSRMTFSHQLVRLVFMEQLYRAFTIINGEPYHHA